MFEVIVRNLLCSVIIVVKLNLGLRSPRNYRNPWSDLHNPLVKKNWILVPAIQSPLFCPVSWVTVILKSHCVCKIYSDVS